MKKGSLEDIIGDIAARLDAMRDNALIHPKDDPLDEIEAFMHADPILASLHKHYLDAYARYRKIIGTNGSDDPMAEVSKDMLDSARSAVHTRLLELQDIRTEEQEELIKKKMKQKRVEQDIEKSRSLMEKKVRKKEDDLYFWLLLFYWLINRTLFTARKKLSAANDFALVSHKAQNKKSYA